MKRRLLTLIATLALGVGAALGVAACGGDDESTTVEEVDSTIDDVITETTTNETTTEETTTEETTTQSGDDSGGGSSGLGY